MGLIIKEISTKKDLKKFIKFPDKLYSGNQFYVPAIHEKKLQTLSFDKNPAFEFCRAKYWLVYENGVIVGRIAGIINDKYNEKHNVKYARFGWLDFVDDKKVLTLLFQAVRRWALSQKMEYIHGPLGFSSFDSSGTLIEGFDEMPTSFAHYNFPYYPKLIEELGYKKDIDWVEYNEVVAFGITIPSLSKAQQKAKGRLFPFGFMQIKRALQKNDTVDLLLIAVRKDYQNKGVNGIIFSEIISAFIKNGITNIETTRNLENNLNINNLWKNFVCRQRKRSRCYIKQL